MKINRKLRNFGRVVRKGWRSWDNFWNRDFYSSDSYYELESQNTPDEARAKRKRRRGKRNSNKEYSDYVVIDPVAMIRAMSMATVVSSKTDGKEMMGFIIGKRILDERGKIKQLIIEDVIFTGCMSEHSATEMDAIQMKNANKQARLRGLKTLGWVHSHPGFSVSPSGVDTTTNKSWESFMVDPLMLIVNERDFYVGTTRRGWAKSLSFVIREKRDTKIGSQKISDYDITNNGINVVEPKPIDTFDKDENVHSEYYNTNLFNPFGIMTFIHFIGEAEFLIFRTIREWCYRLGDFIGDIFSRRSTHSPYDKELKKINKKLESVGETKDGHN